MSTSNSLAGLTLVVSGGSRGFGLAIAVRAARDGANVDDDVLRAAGRTDVSAYRFQPGAETELALDMFW